MNAAATQDVRAIDTVPLLTRLLKGARPPNSQAAQMLALLVAWRKHGGSRLDLNLDGKIDDPGAAIMDAAWPKIADAFMKPELGSQLDELNSLFSRFDRRPGPVRRLVPVLRPRHQGPARRSSSPAVREQLLRRTAARRACQSRSGRRSPRPAPQLTTDQGTSDPTAWRADATAERIKFAPGLLPTTMRYTNRPSGIQQVISFNGHR